MAKIGSYENAPSPISSEDKLIGTDSVNNDATKNFTVQEISDFIASNIVPYKSYVAILNQASTGAPSAQVLENTTGANITYDRQLAGTYRLYSNINLFDSDTTFVIIAQPNRLGSNDESVVAVTTIENPTTIRIVTRNCVTSGLLDNSLVNTSLEIRVYPAPL